MTQEVLKRVSEEGGRLLQVVGWFATGLTPSNPAMLEGILLGLEKLDLAVVVTPDDEIRVTQNLDQSTIPEHLWGDLGSKEPWVRAIGLPVRWIWTLKNQQGYMDGIQIEFCETVGQRSVTVQVLCIAGELEIHNVDAALRMGEPD